MMPVSVAFVNEMQHVLETVRSFCLLVGSLFSTSSFVNILGHTKSM